MTSDAPEVFGELLLVSSLGEGHLAEALVAVRLGDRSGRTFVVKRPRLGERASGPAAQAIRREIEVLSKVRSPHLVALEEAGEVAGLPFVALEHVRGAPLDRLLSAAGSLPPAQVRAIGHDLIVALTALHDEGWVHGDVAPSNVVVDDAGEVKLLDLGIAARAGERRPVPAGKPGYVAPEAMGGRPVSAAEDVYALGVVIGECLLGRRLFPERDLSEAATREGPPPAVTSLDGWGERIGRALALDPERRPTLPELRGWLADGGLDRAGLAEVVERVRTGQLRPEARTPSRFPPAAEPSVGVAAPPAPAAELTPTEAPAAVEPTVAMAVARREPAPISPGGGRRELLHLGLVAIGSGALAFFVGRRLGARQGRGASIGLSAALPARARLSIGGRVIATPEPGKPIPIAPGRHTITIELPRREAHVFDVVVGPGEHVVLLVSPTAARRNDRARTDGPDGVGVGEEP